MGYADNHSADVFLMFNVNTFRQTETKNVDFLGKMFGEIYDKEFFLAYVEQKEKCVEIDEVDSIGVKEEFESDSDSLVYSKETQSEREIWHSENCREIAGLDRDTRELKNSKRSTTKTRCST